MSLKRPADDGVESSSKRSRTLSAEASEKRVTVSDGKLYQLWGSKINKDELRAPLHCISFRTGEMQLDQTATYSVTDGAPRTGSPTWRSGMPGYVHHLTPSCVRSSA